MIPFLLTLGVLAVLSVVFVVWSVRRKRRLSSAAEGRIERAWAHVLEVHEPSLRVLEAEKVLELLLKELRLEGMFAEKFTTIAPRVRNADAVWAAHRLRNRLAHESGVTITVQEADRAVHSYEKAIQFLLG